MSVMSWQPRKIGVAGREWPFLLKADERLNKRRIVN